MRNYSNGNHKPRKNLIHRTDRCLNCLGPVILGYCPACKTHNYFTMELDGLGILMDYRKSLSLEIRASSEGVQP